MRQKTARGFTLVELMIVVLIIGLLGSLAIPAYQGMTARAARSEGLSVLGYVGLHFVNYFENNGAYTNPPARPVGFASAFNPPIANIGQGANWVPSAAGWSEMSFPPEGAIKMRYWYQLVSGNQLMLIACGSFPGLGALVTAPCPPGSNFQLQQNYTDTTLVSSAQFPAF